MALDIISRGLANAAKTKTDKITVTNNVDLDSINTKSSKITVVNDVDLDELVQLNAALTQQMSRRIINVLDYGVKNTGDVNDAHANTLALQAIMDIQAPEYPKAFVDDGGGGGLDLYFPPGLYYIDDTIYRPGFINMRGAGSDRTVIALKNWAEPAGGAMFVFGRRNNSLSSRCNITGMKIEMHPGMHNTEIDNVRWYNRLRHSHLHDVRLNGATGRGLHYERDAGYDNAQNLYFTHCAFEHSVKEGAYIISANYNINFLNCYFGRTYSEAGDSQAMLFIQSGSRIHVNNCWCIDGIAGAAIRIRIAYDVLVDSCIVEANGATGQGIYIDTCRDGRVSNCQIGRDSTAQTVYPNIAIDTQYSTKMVVANNSINGYVLQPIRLGTGAKVFQHDNYDMVTGALVPQS